jgi:hypothetical protein
MQAVLSDGYPVSKDRVATGLEFNDNRKHAPKLSVWEQLAVATRTKISPAKCLYTHRLEGSPASRGQLLLSTKDSAARCAFWAPTCK